MVKSPVSLGATKVDTIGSAAAIVLSQRKPTVYTGRRKILHRTGEHPMGTPDLYEQQKRDSRLKKIREMRSELRKLENALNHIELLVRTPNTPLTSLRQAAVPLRGWSQSLVESYVVMEHVLSSKQDASTAMWKLTDLIRNTVDRYKPAVIEPDPVPYYPDIIDRYG
jgi:hypothetical protein